MLCAVCGEAVTCNNQMAALIPLDALLHGNNTCCAARTVSSLRATTKHIAMVQACDRKLELVAITVCRHMHCV